MTEMNALMYTGTQKMEFVKTPMPKTNAGESLIKVDAVGICGSDMHAYHGHDARRVPPMILGHEATGIVIQGELKGKRVVMNPIAFCGHCTYCLSGRQNLCKNRTMIGMSTPGAYAEYLTIPNQCLIPVPDDMDPIAAALTEPTATAVHAVNLASKYSAKAMSQSNVLVIGAGSIGLLIALLLKHQGCTNISLVDTSSLRRKIAAAANCAKVINNELETLAENTFDVVFDAVGAVATRKLAIDTVLPGGVVTHVGLLQSDGDLNVRKLTLGEIAFLGVYTYSQLDLAQAAQLLYEKSLGDLSWVASSPLSNGAQCFIDLHNGVSQSAKIILRP